MIAPEKILLWRLGATEGIRYEEEVCIMDRLYDDLIPAGRETSAVGGFFFCLGGLALREYDTNFLLPMSTLPDNSFNSPWIGKRYAAYSAK